MYVLNAACQMANGKWELVYTLMFEYKRLRPGQELVANRPQAHACCAGVTQDMHIAKRYTQFEAADHAY